MIRLLLSGRITKTRSGDRKKKSLFEREREKEIDSQTDREKETDRERYIQRQIVCLS